MSRTPSRPAPRKTASVGIFPYFVGILAVLTVVLFIWDMRPGTVLARAAQKTESALENGTVSALWSAWKSGTVALQGGGETVTLATDLYGRTTVQKEQNGQSETLFLEGDRIVFSAPARLDTDLTAQRAGASQKIASSFLYEGDEAHGGLARFFLALTDPALAGEGLKDFAFDARALFDKKNGKDSFVSAEGEAVSCRAVTWRCAGKELAAFLEARSPEEKKDTAREIQALSELLYAFAGKDFPARVREPFLSDLTGEGEASRLLLEALSGEESEVRIVFCLASGMLCEARFELAADPFFAEGTVRFGVGGKAGEKTQVSLRLEKQKQTLFSFSLSGRVAEDTKKSFLYETEYSVSDPAGRLPDFGEKPRAGKIRFSYGREKQDLGLRLIFSDHEINFRGRLESAWKNGSLSFTLTSLDKNRKNILKNPYLVTVSSGSSLPPAPEAGGELFAEGEEKERLAALWRGETQEATA